MTEPINWKAIAKAEQRDNERLRGCVAELESQVEKRDEKAISCGFCDKDQKEVTKLIAGPKVYICNECVSLCASMIPLGELLRPLIAKTTDVSLTADQMAKFIDKLGSDQSEKPTA